MIYRLCQVLIVIIGILIFQVVALISLEMNIYIVTEGTNNSNVLSKTADKMAELEKLNKLKPKFMMKFGPEYNNKE